MHLYSIPQKRKGFFQSLSITTQLIITNIIIYFISLIIMGIYGPDFFSKYFALTPSLILHGKSLWTIFTSIFLH